jgi:hypothetical protein
VIRVLPGAPAEDVVEVGDIIVSVDGHEVAEDGTIEFRPHQRTRLSYAVQRHQVGDTIPITVLRRGELQELEVTLHRSMRKDWLIQMEVFDRLPSYYIYGGVILCPLTKNLLREWGANWYNAAPKELVAMLGENYRRPDQSEVVLVLKVLAADVNQGYHDVAYWPVESVNGTRVRDLRHVIELLEQETADGFAVITNTFGQQIVLDRDKAKAAQEAILQLYRIESDRSPDLQEPADAPASDAATETGMDAST